MLDDVYILKCTQSPAAQQAVRTRGSAAARRLQVRLLPGPGRVGVRVQGEISHNGMEQLYLRGPSGPKCLVCIRRNYTNAFRQLYHCTAYIFVVQVVRIFAKVIINAF